MSTPSSALRSTRLSILLLATALGVLAAAAWGQSSPGDDAATKQDRSMEAWAELAKLPKEEQHDCIAAGLGIVTLIGAYVQDPMTNQGDPALRMKIAGTLADTSIRLKVKRVRDDYAIMAAEVRAHANDAPFKPPKLEAAVADIKAWQAATCPNAKKPTR